MLFEIHYVVNQWSILFLNIIPLYKWHTVYLDCFQVAALENKAAVNIQVQISPGTHSYQAFASAAPFKPPQGHSDIPVANSQPSFHLTSDADIHDPP